MAPPLEQSSLFNEQVNRRRFNDPDQDLTIHIGAIADMHSHFYRTICQKERFKSLGLHGSCRVQDTEAERMQLESCRRTAADK